MTISSPVSFMVPDPDKVTSIDNGAWPTENTFCGIVTILPSMVPEIWLINVLKSSLVYVKDFDKANIQPQSLIVSQNNYKSWKLVFQILQIMVV